MIHYNKIYQRTFESCEKSFCIASSHTMVNESKQRLKNGMHLMLQVYLGYARDPENTQVPLSMSGNLVK